MKLLKSLLVVLLLSLGISLAISTHTSADSTAKCLYQYNQKGFTTASTPAFNGICGGVPEGINNETDFVRIRQNVNGDDTDNLHNPSYKTGSITSACNSGTKFDSWNYVDNDASDKYNPDKGSGSAVSKNTALALSYENTSTTGSFNFAATVSASNATTVSDSAILKCTNPAKLSLVPGSVHIYSVSYGNWENLPDSSASTKFPIGSTSTGLASKGSGDLWGGWSYRLVVVYQVESTIIKKPKTVEPTCNAITLAESSDGEGVNIGVNYTAGSSTVNGVNLSITKGTTTTTKTLNLSQLPYSYQLYPSTNYVFKASVLTSLGNVTSKACETKITTPAVPSSGSNNNSGNPSTPQPAATPQTPAQTNTQLVNTGPGASEIIIFAITAVIGTVAYLRVMAKRQKA